MYLYKTHAQLAREYQLTVEFSEALCQLIEKNGHKVHSKTRLTSKNVSSITQQTRLCVMFALFRDLNLINKAEAGAGANHLLSPYGLRLRHVQKLANYWVKEKQQRPSTVDNKLTFIRTLYGWMGKNPSDIATVRELVADLPDGYRRKYVTETDKTWEGKQIDAKAVIATLSQVDVHAAIQLELQLAFGLRREESFRLWPQDLKKTAQGGTVLRIINGTKGGRLREVDVTAEHQFDLLERAAQHANQIQRSMVPNHYPTVLKGLGCWLNRYTYILRKAGITKAELGVTSHGLRHQYLNQLYTQVTGELSPIKGGHPNLNHEEGKRRVAEAAGHSKPDKANAYLSTHHTVAKLQAKDPVIHEIEQAIVRADGNKKEAAKALGISRAKLYRLLAK